MAANILRVAETLKKNEDVFKLAAKITDGEILLKIINSLKDLERKFQLCTGRNKREKWPGVHQWQWRELLSVEDGRLDGRQPRTFCYDF